jgi:hypothetical protein
VRDFAPKPRAANDEWRRAPAFSPALQAEPFSHLSVGIFAVVMDRNIRMQRASLNVCAHLPAALVTGFAQRSRRSHPKARKRAGSFEMLAVIHGPDFPPEGTTK